MVKANKNTETKAAGIEGKEPVITDNADGTQTVAVMTKQEIDFTTRFAYNQKSYANLLGKIAKTGKALQEEIHQAALVALSHALKGSNFDAASQLVKAVREGVSGRVASQVQLWFEYNAPMKWRKTEQFDIDAQGYKFRKDNAKDAQPFTVENAESNPWFTIDDLTDGEVAKAAALLFSSDRMIDRLERLIRDIRKAVTDQSAQNPDIDSKVLPKALEMLEPIAKELEKDINFLTPKKEEKEDKKAA